MQDPVHFKAIIEGSIVGVIKGHTRSLDHSLYSSFISLGIQNVQLSLVESC